MPFEPGNSGNVATQFSSGNQPEKRGRKKDPFKRRLQELAEADGLLPIASTELLNIVEITEDERGAPLLTIRGEWARNADGTENKKIALIIAQLPNVDQIAAQWYRDAHSRQFKVRNESRKTLVERVEGKPTQPLANDADNPLTKISFKD